MTIDAVGVVIPAHNEEQLLGACLASMLRAAETAAEAGTTVRVAVVLDACCDATAEVAEAWRARSFETPGVDLVVVVTADANVGAARHAGFSRLLADLDRFHPDRTWLATTDADSTVPVHWLSHQIEAHGAGVRAWAGTVELDPLSETPPGLRRSFRTRYQTPDGMDHPHVHGANLGLDAGAYLAAGGFPPLPTAEDHALYRAVQALGIRFLHDLGAPVRTSARRQGRAPDGFAADLRELLWLPEADQLTAHGRSRPLAGQG